MSRLYPTPLELLRGERSSGAWPSLWIKNDGLSHPIYGGEQGPEGRAADRGGGAARRRRILTIGAAGSHHALRALFARAHGLSAQRCSSTERGRARGTSARFARAGPRGVSGRARRCALKLASSAAQRSSFVPRGSNVEGRRLRRRARRARASSSRARGSPPPDQIVVALGSGGLRPGSRRASSAAAPSTREWSGVQGRAGRLIPPGSSAHAKLLTASTLRAPAQTSRRSSRSTPGGSDAATATLPRRVEGARGRRALGVELDATYTAKAFAAALASTEALARDPAGDGPRRVLYWHTLSAVPLDPLLAGAPRLDELAEPLRAPARRGPTRWPSFEGGSYATRPGPRSRRGLQKAEVEHEASARLRRPRGPSGLPRKPNSNQRE